MDDWECERAKRIERIQGNRNEVVMKSCARKGFLGVHIGVYQAQSITQFQKFER